ncbi:MAG: acyl carrier protein [Roseovarius sp.]|nr:acyl carrier protein [Roseovarius sp.]
MQITKDDMFDKVYAILKTHAKSDIRIGPETQIAADLAIDSVEMFDLVMEIEEAYDISFPIEEASAIDTVQSLIEAIERITDV